MTTIGILTVTNAIPGAKMNRFLADPRPADVIGGVLRSACGVLGCTAVAGAISFGVATPAAAAPTDPESRRSIPTVCRHPAGFTDGHTRRICKEKWLAMYEESRKRTHGRRHDSNSARRTNRTNRERAPKSDRRPPPSKALDKPGPRPASPVRPTTASPSPTIEHTPEPPGVQQQARGEESQSRSLQPVLLLGLLLPIAAAICYPFRHRISAAAAGTLTAPVPVEVDEPAREVVLFTYRPSLDPFATPAVGLAGSGAVATARVLALTALDQHADTSLTVIPRSDATALFGLAEDELLDESAAGLFLPGNLDGALAYLETELSIRRNSGVTDARRLLLVANCEDEAERIGRLLARHPGEVSMILLGDWTGEHVIVDDDGLFESSPGLTNRFPDRLPAMSRTEARDRLFAAIEHHEQERRRPSGRRQGSKRG